MKSFFSALFSPIYTLLITIINQLKTIIWLQFLTVAMVFVILLYIIF